MALTNDQITAQNFKDFYTQILPYLNGGNYVEKSVTAGLLKNDGTVDTTTYASEQGVESIIDSTVGWTGKNWLNHVLQSQTGGMNITVNSDKSVSYSGSTSQYWATYILIEHMILPDGDFIISGSDSSDNYVSIYDEASPSTAVASSNNGSQTTFTADSTKTYKVTISMKPNLSSVSGLITPMIRDARITDSTYEPYHKSVEECLEEINDKLSYLEQSVTLSTSASTTVTFTDASITANSFIEYACSVWDLVPESITGAAGSCTIVLPKVDSAQSVTVRIYVR